MKTYKIILVALFTISLGACQTFEGMKKDFSSMGSAVDNKVQSLKSDDTDQTATAILNDGTCPPISVDPQLTSWF